MKRILVIFICIVLLFTDGCGKNVDENNGYSNPTDIDNQNEIDASLIFDYDMKSIEGK